MVLDADASNYSIGAVLSQEQDWLERVISYSSQRLGPVQERYCVTRRELLAVVAFCHQYKYYLLGRPFLLRTDHSSLAWLFRIKAPGDQLARWLEELSQYSFCDQTQSWENTWIADALSKREGEILWLLQCRKQFEVLINRGCTHCKKDWRAMGKVHRGSWLCCSFNNPMRDSKPEWLNWVESYEMKSAQAEDEEAQILIDWVNNKKPELGEVRLLNPAMRSFFLCLCQLGHFYHFISAPMYFFYHMLFTSFTWAPEELRRLLQKHLFSARVLWFLYLVVLPSASGLQY